jgi:hypothetical protein
MPDPCITPSVTCNSPYVAYLPQQYGLFGQHLLVRVNPPAYASRPPTLSSPPTGYTPRVCDVYFPSSGQDYVALPQGISEETGQPWTQEWDPLKSAGSYLYGTVLVDWAWWPPLPTGSVVGPGDLTSHWVADVYRWIYQRVQTGTDSNGNPVYEWVPTCTNQGLENGATNPQVNPAQGGQVYVWGARIVLLPITTGIDPVTYVGRNEGLTRVLGYDGDEAIIKMNDADKVAQQHAVQSGKGPY